MRKTNDSNDPGYGMLLLIIAIIGFFYTPFVLQYGWNHIISPTFNLPILSYFKFMIINMSLTIFKLLYITNWYTENKNTTKKTAEIACGVILYLFFMQIFFVIITLFM